MNWLKITLGVSLLLGLAGLALLRSAPPLSPSVLEAQCNEKFNEIYPQFGNQGIYRVMSNTTKTPLNRNSRVEIKVLKTASGAVLGITRCQEVNTIWEGRQISLTPLNTYQLKR